MRSEVRALICGLALSSGAFAASDAALVGTGVGNADTFLSEGSKLFNKQQYGKAAEQFLKATRAQPATLQTYVQLARAELLAKQVARACYAYRVYLKAAPDSPDRKKAAAESEQCERQLRGVKNADDPTKRFVDLRASFFTALDAKHLLGKDSASDTLTQLVKDGFLGPDLGDMAQKLGVAATAEAEAIHTRALAGEKLAPETLRSARPLYTVASEVGVSSTESKGRMAFLDGLAELNDKQWKKAEGHFVEANKSDPTNREYVFFRGLALYQGGDKVAALKLLDSDLKEDPRTGVLRASQALSDSPEAGATELEKLLFSSRYPPEK